MRHNLVLLVCYGYVWEKSHKPSSWFPTNHSAALTATWNSFRIIQPTALKSTFAFPVLPTHFLFPFFASKYIFTHRSRFLLLFKYYVWFWYYNNRKTFKKYICPDTDPRCPYSIYKKFGCSANPSLQLYSGLNLHSDKGNGQSPKQTCVRTSEAPSASKASAVGWHMEDPCPFEARSHVVLWNKSRMSVRQQLSPLFEIKSVRV